MPKDNRMPRKGLMDWAAQTANDRRKISLEKEKKTQDFMNQTISHKDVVIFKRTR